MIFLFGKNSNGNMFFYIQNMKLDPYQRDGMRSAMHKKRSDSYYERFNLWFGRTQGSNLCHDIGCTRVIMPCLSKSVNMTPLENLLAIRSVRSARDSLEQINIGLLQPKNPKVFFIMRALNQQSINCIIHLTNKFLKFFAHFIFMLFFLSYVFHEILPDIKRQ